MPSNGRSFSLSGRMGALVESRTQWRPGQAEYLRADLPISQRPAETECSTLVGDKKLDPGDLLGLCQLHLFKKDRNKSKLCCYALDEAAVDRVGDADPDLGPYYEVRFQIITFGQGLRFSGVPRYWPCVVYYATHGPARRPAQQIWHISLRRTGSNRMHLPIGGLQVTFLVDPI